MWNERLERSEALYFSETVMVQKLKKVAYKFVAVRNIDKCSWHFLATIFLNSYLQICWSSTIFVTVKHMIPVLKNSTKAPQTSLYLSLPEWLEPVDKLMKQD